VVCVVAGASNIPEQLCDFSREDSLILKTPNEFVLPLVGRHIRAHTARRQLAKQLRKLPQLKKASIRIVGE